MERLKEAVIKLASSKQKEPLSASQIALIHKQLHHTFPNGLRIPSHPPYALMIVGAITKLNEEGGVSEESISEYMKANYDDLPWAHKSILSHHLGRLCEVEGSIARIADNRYSIPGFIPKTVVKKGKLKRKGVGMKEELSCQEKLDELRLHPQDSSCGKEDGKVMSGRTLRRGRRRLTLQEEEEENVGLDSCLGIEAEHVEDGCEDIVADREDHKGQESEMHGIGSELEQKKILIINKQGISEAVKVYHSKTERICDPLVAVTSEKESLVDVCQDETRNEMIAMEDDSNGDGLMNDDTSCETPVMMKKKKNTEREKICLGEREVQCDQLLTGRTDDKPLVEEGLDQTGNKILALEIDSNDGDLMSNGASFETSVKEKKDAGGVKFYLRRRERKCNQLITRGTEKKSLVDECQEETVMETSVLEDDSNGVDLMNNGSSFGIPMKKDAENRSLLDDTRKEAIALENDSNGVDVMNNDASLETPVKEMKDVGQVMICGSNRERECDQPPNGDAEEKSLVDECQDETRKDIVALENDSNGVG